MHRSSRGLAKLLAVIYLHGVRTWRYKYSFINSSINTMLWITIFLLGVIMFVPAKELPVVAPQVFWGITVWNLITYTVIYISGWTTWFLVSMGLVEEHMLHGLGLPLLLAGRLVTVLAESAIAVPLVYFVLRGVAGPMRLVENPWLLLYGLVAAEAMALGYALVLATLALRLSIPGPMLDITNFILFIVGGIAAPVAKLPAQLRVVALLTPYSHAAELVRYAATGTKPYLGLLTETFISGALAVAMPLAAYAFYRFVEKHYLRRYGVRGVGRM